MKKLCILLAACVLFVCGTAQAGTEQANVLDLYLPGSPETGYWEYTVENEDLIDVETAYFPDIHELGLTGRSGADWFRVSGLEPGATTLRLLLINSDTLRTDLTFVYRLTVDENLNVLIYGFEMLEAETSPRGAVTSFFFTSGGYNVPESFTLRTDENGRPVQEINDGGEEPAPEEMPAELNAIALKYGLVSWDGFDGVAEGVLDGESFLFTMTWENGFSIQASGSNEFPENYFAFKEEISSLFGAAE